jgi:hypothetical protein
LIIDHAGLAQELLGGVLKSISAVGLVSSESLASAAVSGALEVISGHPELLRFDYGVLVVGLAGKVATLVKEKKITGTQGQDLLAAAIASLPENPQLLIDAENKLVTTVIDAVTKVSGTDSGALIAGVTLVDVVKQVLAAVAVGGKAALKDIPVKQFAENLTELLAFGLTRAEAELGNRMGLTSLPRVLGQLVVAWEQGKIDHVDPDDDDLKHLFAVLAEGAWAAYA